VKYPLLADVCELDGTNALVCDAEMQTIVDNLEEHVQSI
jgi:hypothetical protein